MNLTHSGTFIGIYAPFCEVFRKGLWLSAMHPEGLTFFCIVSSIKLVIYHETQVCSLHYSLTFYCCLLIYQLHKLSLQNYSSSSAEGFFSGFFQEPISPSTIVLGAKGVKPSLAVSPLPPCTQKQRKQGSAGKKQLCPKRFRNESNEGTDLTWFPPAALTLEL